MTSLVVLDAKQPMDEELEITAADKDMERGSGSRLAIGTKLSRADMMHLALMSSENRAAHALGRNYPGGLGAMVKAMNLKAEALGMTHAHFVDPTGLSSQNVASPQDLAKLVIAASHNPTIREYSTDHSYAVKVRRRMLEFRNTDNLVAKSDWDIVVQKTGYIEEAGRCLVMKVVIAGRSVVIVLLDSYGKYTRVADAKRIKIWMEAKLRAGSLAETTRQASLEGA
jgi:D-alanyl-D-alanine endopeptidase (penicillin-binding protein 7)